MKKNLIPNLSEALSFDLMDKSEKSFLLKRSELIQTKNSSLYIYHKNEQLDDTLCILLSGSFEIEDPSFSKFEITKPSFVGEMAYFSVDQKRVCSVLTSKANSLFLIAHISPEELLFGKLSKLGKFLANQAWIRFVENQSMK